MCSLSIHMVNSFVIFILLRTAIATQACYWPNGDRTDALSVPCGNGMSQCCQVGSACLNNGLCFNPGSGVGSSGLPYRGACTERNFLTQNTTACPTYCPNWSQSNSYMCNSKEKDIILTWTFAANGTEWAELNFCGQFFWCADPILSPTRCEGQLYSWPLPLGGVVANIGPALGVGAISTSVSSSTASSTSTSTNIPSPTPSTEAKSTSSGFSVALGAGLGVPLSILAVGFLVFLFLRGRKKGGNGNKATRDVSFDSVAPLAHKDGAIWLQPQEVAAVADQEAGGNAISELAGSGHYRDDGLHAWSRT
jgi:hypothetical protein